MGVRTCRLCLGERFEEGSMLKSKMRLLGASALVGAGLLATGPVSAANLKLGDWNVQIDNTVSAGLSMMMKDPDEQFLPVSNGGVADNSVYVGAPDSAQGQTTPQACDTSYGNHCQEASTAAVPNFDGSINTDDGRLNFDKGDLYSSPLRLTTEVEAANGPWTVFGRLNIWHDITAMDEDAYKRGGELTDDGEENVGQNIELLDAYVSYDGDVFDMPFTVRAGRQVINWGEATFIPGGNSAFNPIDVAQLRRPGAQIKEALLPVEALYGSLAITQDISLEAYVGGWDKYRLEGGGTPNSISDSFTEGTSTGNPNDVYFVGGGSKSGDQFACNGASYFSGLGTTNGTFTASTINAILAIDGAVACDDNPNLDATRDWTVGSAEAERWAAGDTNYISGREDEDGDEAFGLALRWYAENLNSTEFAFYYQKGDSRLPYITYETGKTDVKAYSTSSKSSTVGRGVGPVGCVGFLTNADITAAAVPAAGIPAGSKAYNPALAAVTVNDSKGILANAGVQAVADSVAANFMPAFLNAVTSGAITTYSRTAPNTLNAARLQETNCLLALAQVNTTVGFGSSFDQVGQLPTGATNIGATMNVSLGAEFPEVETYGMSFNTTLLGWGVQGDFTYRPEAPLQFDTDALSIGAFFNNCLFNTAGIVEAVYLSGDNWNAEFGDNGCTDQDKRMQGYTTDYDVITWDIGTTATFTRSNPVVSFLRSDLGIFLTEFQGLSVDGIEEERGNTGAIGSAGLMPLSNVCQGGSDLPLNGVLSIDDRVVEAAADATDNNAKGYCRPTDESMGVVLMGQLQYNNVFGTPIGLKPQVIFSQGVNGYSPSPMGFWRNGVGSTAFSLTADYLGTWSANLSYRTYHGNKDRTRNTDRDSLSASVTYAF